MSCGCKDKALQIDGIDLSDRPYDNQAEEMLAEPRKRIEEHSPEPIDRSRKVIEFTPAIPYTATPSLPHVFSFASPLTGLSFGGVVPFNVVAFVVPLESEPALRDAATLFACSEGVSMYAYSTGFSPPAGLSEYWILRPGEVLDFGRRLDGYAGFYAAPWSGIGPLSSSGGVLGDFLPNAGGALTLANQDATRTANQILNSFVGSHLRSAHGYAEALGGMAKAFNSTWDPVLPVTGPVFAPVLRAVYGSVKQVATAVTTTPWIVPNVRIVKPQATVCIPPGTRYITATIHGLKAGGVNANTILGGTWGYSAYFRAGFPKKLTTGPYDLQVDWLGYDGVAHVHPGDHLMDSARGAVMGGANAGSIPAPHDVEVWEVPRNAVGINVYYKDNIDPGGTPIDSICYTMSPE